MKKVRWIKAPTRPAIEIGDDDDWMVGQGDKSSLKPRKRNDLQG
jgi:hypothetical protein